MKRSIITGYSFGLTSGITTTLGLVVGLATGTRSRIAVIGGIITIAVADALSEGFSMHVSEEAEEHSNEEVWESAFATFFSKFTLALTFLVPVYFFDLTTAVIISSIWGLSMITLLSYKIAQITKVRPWKPIFEHIILAVMVIIITYIVGVGISSIFY